MYLLAEKSDRLHSKDHMQSSACIILCIYKPYLNLNHLSFSFMWMVRRQRHAMLCWDFIFSIYIRFILKKYKAQKLNIVNNVKISSKHVMPDSPISRVLCLFLNYKLNDLNLTELCFLAVLPVVDFGTEWNSFINPDPVCCCEKTILIKKRNVNRI